MPHLQPSRTAPALKTRIEQNRSPLQFDENSIAPIANRRAATLTRLMIEKEKVISAICMRVLTPEQRIRSDRWRAQWSSRLEEIADLIANEEHVVPSFSRQ
jgi:hypothetical protein